MPLSTSVAATSLKIKGWSCTAFTKSQKFSSKITQYCCRFYHSFSDFLAFLSNWRPKIKQTQPPKWAIQNPACAQYFTATCLRDRYHLSGDWGSTIQNQSVKAWTKSLAVSQQTSEMPNSFSTKDLKFILLHLWLQLHQSYADSVRRGCAPFGSVAQSLCVILI